MMPAKAFFMENRQLQRTGQLTSPESQQLDFWLMEAISLRKEGIWMIQTVNFQNLFSS